MAPADRTARLTLGAILVLGAALRFAGIGYGLPNTLARPDEEKIVGSADALLREAEWPPATVIYPSLLIHVDALAMLGVAAAGRLAGLYDDFDDFLAGWPGRQYRIGRGVGALFGVATILAVFGLARRVSESRGAGLLAGLTLATLYLHVRDSHFATVDVSAAFFVTLALSFALDAAGTDRARPWLLAGLAAGLAASTKYNAGPAWLPLVTAAALRLRTGSPPGLAARRLLQSALAAAAAFALTSPSILLRWRDALSEVSETQGLLYGSAGGASLLVHLQHTFPVGYGEPLCAAIVVGLARHWRRPAYLLLLTFLAPSFASVATAQLAFPRYLVMLAPPLVAIGCDAALRLLPARPLAVAALATLFAVPGLVRSIAFDRVAAREDTRLQLAEWARERYLPGTRFLLCRGYARPDLDLRSRAVDCGRADLPLDWAHAIVTSSHPALDRFSPVSPKLLDELKRRARAVRVFDPFRPGASARPYFYVADAFYLPFSGLDAMERGGPILTVWETKDPPLRRR